MSSSQAAFLKIDPILRMLLSSVESYREACDGNTANEERILGILRIQVRILNNLEKTLQQVVDQYGPGVLQAQAGYILLPLRLILQACDQQGNDVNEPIRQSAIWKSAEAAARVMECTIHLIGPLIPFKQSLECLTACTFPLPTENVSSSEGLDRGDDCIYAVLHCIDTLLETTNEECMAMEGNLVARISFSCIIVLKPGDRSRKTTPQLQLQALNTLDTLIKIVPVPQMWQSFFPGLFAELGGLVLSELRLADAQSSPKVSSSTCRTLSRLLCVTLETPKETDDGPVDDVRKLMKQMAVTSTVTTTTNEFLKEVHSRLPAPLILLLNLLPAASSPKLRQAASELCHSILVETRSVWDADETANVLQSAIECCIALSRDNDERVASAAKSTFTDYQHDSRKRDVENTIGPRILELIEELPALARSGRETELRGRINLISGYLVLGGSLRASLTSVATEIQTSLAVLFDVDFDSIQYAPRVETTDSWNVWQPDRCRFRFMMDDTAKSAREMVQLLGAALDQKGSSSFVDACVADVLEACIATSHTHFGPRQVEWLHQWIGFIVIANEILVGAFRESQSSEENGDEPDGDRKVSKVTSSRRSRKRLRRLHSLAQAILPVITSAPLWTLPTVLENVDQKVKTSETVEGFSIMEVQDDSEVQIETVSAFALKGNAAMVCSLIGLLSETVDLLSNETESFLPVILFPLCEKTSSQNHSQVQRTAALALNQVAVACGLSSTRDLLRQNFDYLFGAMLSRARRPEAQQTGKHISFPSTIPSIVQVILRSAAEVDTAAKDVRSERSLVDETNVSYTIELVNVLVASFDNNLVILNSEPLLQASITLDLLAVFDAALSFVASTFGMNLEKDTSPFADVPIPDTSEDWLAVLELFRISESGHLSAKEGFEKVQDDKGDGDKKEDETTEADEHPFIMITQGEVDFVSLVLTRCSFFLSSPSLHVEMASCIGMQRAFALLGAVSLYSKPKEGEANGPSTAVFRHVASSWPSVFSRLRSLSSTVITATGVRAVSIRSFDTVASPVSPDTSTQTIFLSKLFELISCMCEVSEDFLVSRIREQVWPIVAALLDLYIQQEMKSAHKQLRFDTQSLVPNDALRKKSFTTEREKLLFSILDFLTRIYGQRKCGLGLSELIPAAGTILFPFLANEGELRARTMRALKSMILIDCDALWRPLLRLSHRQLPPRPFGQQNSLIVVEKVQNCTTPLGLAAEELIEFTESLPEMPLGIASDDKVE